MNSAEPKVRFTRDGALGTVTLASPPLNLIGQQLISDLLAAVDQVEAAEGLRALVLRGEGKVFSAGADVALFAGMTAQELRPLIGSFLDLGHRIEGLPFPTLAAVHGTCMAGGFELALFCDLIWAAEGTMLGLPETRLGIVPLAGGVERIAARAGLGRARSMGWAAICIPRRNLRRGERSIACCLPMNCTAPHRNSPASWQPGRRAHSRWSRNSAAATPPVASQAPTRC